MSESRTNRADTPLPGLSANGTCRGMLTAKHPLLYGKKEPAGLSANSPGLETAGLHDIV